MLEQMRHMAKSPIAVGLIGLLIISFAVWGIGDVFRGGQSDAVVTVGPGKVTVQQYAAAWNRELDRLIRESKGKITSKEAREYGLQNQILQRLTDEVALDVKAKSMGIGLSDDQVVKTIRSIAAFTDPITGTFSAEQYRSALANAGYTVKRFEDDVRGDLIRSQISAPVIAGLNGPRTLVKQELAFAGETRRIAEVLLPQDMTAMPADPGDAVLQKFLDDNAAYFQTPERRAATLVTIFASEMAAEVEVSEDKIKELYEFRKPDLGTPEKRSWVQITTKDETSAKAVAKRLAAGEKPADIASDMHLAAPLEFTDTPQNEGPDDEIAKAVFAAKNGESGASKGRLAWGAWKLNGITPGQIPTLEEVHDKLRDEVIREEASDKLYEIVGNFEEARASGQTLAEAAQSTKLLALSLPPVDRKGNSIEGEPVEIYTKNPKILETLFTTEEGAESEILETANRDFFALSTDEIIPPSAPKLSAIRARVLAAWQARQRADAIKKMADSIGSALETGEDPNQVAARYPGSRVEYSILNRRQNPAPLTPRHAGQLFAAKKGAVISAPDLTGTTMVVARVEQIIPAKAPQDAEVELRRAAIGNALGQDLQAQFLQGLLDEYKVRQDPRLKALALGDNPDS